jgi:hypothetical protein
VIDHHLRALVAVPVGVLVCVALKKGPQIFADDIDEETQDVQVASPTFARPWAATG